LPVAALGGAGLQVADFVDDDRGLHAHGDRLAIPGVALGGAFIHHAHAKTLNELDGLGVMVGGL
jgi:hypothetical protein